MGRHTGPVERLSRREGVDLELKGERRMKGKGALKRRGPIPPGEAGSRRRRKPTLYAEQLREKQKAKRYYGVRERQFRRLVAEAHARRASATSDEPADARLISLLERRLDNVVYRLGLAGTRAQARQFVGHGHVLLNGRRCTISSARVRTGDRVQVAPGAPIEPLAQAARALGFIVPDWLETDAAGLGGRVTRIPRRAEIQAPIHEQLIVEFYNRG